MHRWKEKFSKDNLSSKPCVCASISCSPQLSCIETGPNCRSSLQCSETSCISWGSWCKSGSWLLQNVWLVPPFKAIPQCAACNLWVHNAACCASQSFCTNNSSEFGMPSRTCDCYCQPALQKKSTKAYVGLSEATHKSWINTERLGTFCLHFIFEKKILSSQLGDVFT